MSCIWIFRNMYLATQHQGQTMTDIGTFVELNTVISNNKEIILSSGDFLFSQLGLPFPPFPPLPAFLFLPSLSPPGPQSPKSN